MFGIQPLGAYLARSLLEAIPLDNHAISAVGVGKTYPNGAGLNEIDLEVDTGTIVGLIGPSGAGKTTAVRLFAGLLDRDQGRLSVLGRDPQSFTPVEQSRLGYLPQDSALYPRLSVKENLDFIAATYGLRAGPRNEARQRVLEFVELTEAQDMKLSEVSGGMRRRASLAAALIHRPELLFLDEPTAGLDPILRQTIWEHLGDLGEEGRTLVVTTQYIGEAAYCDLIVLLSDGYVIQSGEPEAIRRAAFDGELVDVVFSSRPGWSAIDTIGKAIGASNAKPLAPGSVRYTVEDAGSAIPVITSTASELDLELQEAERVVPDFDQVFVRLVDRHRNGSER